MEDGKAVVDHSSSSDSELKQFDQLFVELVSESTADEDTKIADAMKWFKRASLLHLHKM